MEKERKIREAGKTVEKKVEKKEEKKLTGDDLD